MHLPIIQGRKHPCCLPCIFKHRHLENLKLLGLITWEPFFPRTVKAVEDKEIAV